MGKLPELNFSHGNCSRFGGFRGDFGTVRRQAAGTPSSRLSLVIDSD